MTFLIQQTLLYAVPLMIVALAGVFAERSGIINLALERVFGVGNRTRTRTAIPEVLKNDVTRVKIFATPAAIYCSLNRTEARTNSRRFFASCNQRLTAV